MVIFLSSSRHQERYRRAPDQPAGALDLLALVDARRQLPSHVGKGRVRSGHGRALRSRLVTYLRVCPTDLTSMSKIKWGIACSLSTLAAAATWRLDPISGAAGG